MKAVICLAFFLLCLLSHTSAISFPTHQADGHRSLGQLRLRALGGHEIYVVGAATLSSNDMGGRGENRAYTPFDIALVSCGLFLMLVSMALAVIFPQPTDFQYFIFRVAIALAVGALGVALSGFISLAVGNGIRATGGAALFFIVYKFNPGRLLKN